MGNDSLPLLCRPWKWAEFDAAPPLWRTAGTGAAFLNAGRFAGSLLAQSYVPVLALVSLAHTVPLWLHLPLQASRTYYAAISSIGSSLHSVVLVNPTSHRRHTAVAAGLTVAASGEMAAVRQAFMMFPLPFRCSWRPPWQWWGTTARCAPPLCFQTRCALRSRVPCLNRSRPAKELCRGFISASADGMQLASCQWPVTNN